MKFAAPGLAAATLLMFDAPPATAGVVFFDSFESPNVSSWYVYQTGVGDGADWSAVSGSGIEIQDQSLGITNAYHGSQYVELDSDTSRGGVSAPTNSAMAANIGLEAGKTYELSFAYKPRTNTPNDNKIEALAGELHGLGFAPGAVLATANETTSSLSDWLVVTTIFTAQAGQNAIAFRAAGIQNTLGGFIDAVQVSEVPLPAALPLFGLGLAGFASVRRRRTA
ncbi:MAG: VPLPA-CTERM sorting domain-containing protein [Alphaproteobacteria bacterium]|nr:VPLPA-CTERM sorting domain-containing protein [Alphaproteobacteria bacterium]